MTTMAAMDPFDTPMMDYIVDDITMHIGPSSSSNAWAQPEASMEDDDGNTQFQTEDVEIDMEPYDLDHLEYEMTDEASVNPPNTDEPLDIEVFDVTGDHDIQSSLIDRNDLPPVKDIPSRQPSPIASAAEALLASKSFNAPSVAFPGHPTYVPSRPHSEEPAEVIVSTEAEAQIIVHEDPSGSISGPDDNIQHPDQSVVNLQVQANQDDSQQHSRPVSPAIFSSMEPTTTAEDLPLGDRTELVDEGEFNEHWEDHHQESRVDVLGPESAVDPHEISEGVYIDPPPAVLLTIPSLGDTFCLFNYPAPKSVTDDKSDSELTLLLHEFPTLYYEPLSKVFEGLRSEGKIADKFDLVNGELVLDAFELVDLTISEDNIYAKEVSLHDLNILHDVSDLPGPLRIGLECKVPRFIMRYRYLRSELERLNIDGEYKVELAVTEDADPTNIEPQGTPHRTEEDSSERQALTGISKEGQDGNTDIEQVQKTTPESGNKDEAGQVDSLDSKNDQEPEDYDDELDGDFDAEGDTDYGSQYALDAAELRDNPDASTPAPAAHTEYEEAQEGRDDFDEQYNEEVPTIETPVVQGDLSDHHHQEVVAATNDDSHISTDLASLEASAEVGVNGEHEPDYYDETQPSNNTVSSGEANYAFEGTATIEHHSVVGLNDEKQVTKAVSPSSDRSEEDTHNTDLLSGSSKSYIQVADSFDEVHWDEDLDGEFDEVETQQDEESTQSSTKAMPEKTSSKRSFDELDLHDGEESSNSQEIPSEIKRQKVL